MARTCIVCGKRAYSDYCMQHKPRKPLPRPTMPVRYISLKAATSLSGMKRRWHRVNPPDSNGNWTCYLQISDQCPKILTRETLVYEHVMPKVKAPELKFDEYNVKASCTDCNRIKASQTLDQLVNIYPHLTRVIDNI